MSKHGIISLGVPKTIVDGVRMYGRNSDVKEDVRNCINELCNVYVSSETWQSKRPRVKGTVNDSFCEECNK